MGVGSDIFLIGLVISMLENCHLLFDMCCPSRIFHSFCCDKVKENKRNEIDPHLPLPQSCWVDGTRTCVPLEHVSQNVALKNKGV